jgi:hypothetical protein
MLTSMVDGLLINLDGSLVSSRQQEFTTKNTKKYRTEVDESLRVLRGDGVTLKPT